MQNTTLDEFIKSIIIQTQKMNNTKSLDLITAQNLFIHYKQHNVRPATLSYYKHALKFITEYLNSFGITDTANVNKHVLVNYQMLLTSQGLKANTINKRIKALLTMLKELKELDLISHELITLKHLPEKQTKIEQVEIPDIIKILDYGKTLNSNSNLILLLLITTGVRTSELINIENKNIHLDKNYIELTMTKSGYSRILPLTNEVKEIVQLVTSDRKYLFSNPGDTDDHFQASAVRSVIARAKKALNIKVLSAHKLRHSFATFHCKAGTNLKILQELLGHRSILMTQRYIDIDKTDIINSCNINNILTDLG